MTTKTTRYGKTIPKDVVLGPTMLSKPAAKKPDAPHVFIRLGKPADTRDSSKFDKLFVLDKSELKVVRSHGRHRLDPGFVKHKIYGLSSLSNPKELRDALGYTLQELKETIAERDAARAALTEIRKHATIYGVVSAPLSDTGAASAFLTAKTLAIAKREELIARGELLTSGEITARLDMTRQALSKAVNDKRLFALQLQDDLFYPAFFADKHILPRTLYRVCKALGDIDSWEKWQFFTRPNAALDKHTPIYALQHDQADEVLKAAAAFSE